MDGIGDNLSSVWCENRNEVRYTIHNTVFVDSSSHIPSTADAGVDILAVYSAYTVYVQCTYSKSFTVAEGRTAQLSRSIE